MEIARGIQVPLKPDGVMSPEIRYVGPGGAQVTCLIFSLSDDEDHVGRVTFESFDSIRCCRGEHLPYKDDYLRNLDSKQAYPWVFEVEGSNWLRERHEYETKHYKTPLLEEYVHYLFSFHDEYVELIAGGIWFEKMRYEELNSSTQDHPLQDIPCNLPAEEFMIEGISCAVRHNTLSDEDILKRSKLCSQQAFQYSMKLDGQEKWSYAARVRTIRGKLMTRLRGGLFYPQLASVEGLARESEFREVFTKRVREVAERRRKMGK